MEYTGRVREGKTEAGFSLLEMLAVIAVIFIISAFAIFNINGALPSEQSAAGLNAAMAVVRQGRDTAITQRRSFQLVVPVVTPLNQIGVQRIEIGGGFTALPVTTLPKPAQFGLDPSITTPPEPDVTTCSNGLCFNGTPTQTWLSDGTFVDAAGQPLTCAIYVMIPGNPAAQRAFVIQGSTGQIRTWRWNGSSWILQ